MSLPLQENKKYTYADYLTWSEEERWELIDGTPCIQAAIFSDLIANLSSAFASL